jgi:hypothetical protein
VKPGPVLPLLLAVSAWAEDPAARHFHERVKPLLDLRCISCHGPDKVKGGLRMDSREALLQGGDSGPALVPGRPEESLLLQAVLHTAPDLEMPPKDKLSPADIAVFERWIADGAPWPQAASAAAAAPAPGERLGDAWSDERNPIRRLFGGQRLDLWSLRPPAAVAPPAGAARHPVDRFLHAPLAEAGLAPAPAADRRTLIRRLSYGLTGLPPAPAEVEAFLADPRPDAYERLVERLLASARYGEHQARLWLDVVRYSDSNGFDWDEFRPQAWRFRDYAVRAFNADKPFDQFIREQLAGDEQLAGPPRDAAAQDALIATGYLRLGPHDNAAPLFNEQERSRAELMADLVETTGSAFLGVTFSCCRCHDHKTEPISQADHFRFRAFFEGVKFADDQPLDLAAEQDAIRAHNAAVDARARPHEAEREALLGAARRRLRTERAAALPPDEQALLALATENQNEELAARIAAVRRKTEPTEQEARAALTEDERARLPAAEERLAAVRRERRAFTPGLLMTDAPGPPAMTRILAGGDYQSPREAVAPGILSALDPNPAALAAPAATNTTGRRLTLAAWIASPDNPLTARVLVNRVWQQHFGRGLVATPNDFGFTGARPTHPELLDWLAGEFVRAGWSVKALHRLIVTSAAYRQVSGVQVPAPGEAAAARGASERQAENLQPDASADPENLLLARQNARRLTAEQLRDSLLAASGLLRLAAGGPPVWPDLPAEILQANPAFLDDNAEKTKGWHPSPRDEQTVRSLFLVQKRTVRVPFLETFDLPENAVSCARRNTSTVAPQALSLLNSPLALEAAQALAARIRREAGDDPAAQIRHAFRLTLQRDPAAAEAAACAAALARLSLPELCRALLNLNEFAYVD